jgi:hypothetical protein
MRIQLTITLEFNTNTELSAQKSVEFYTSNLPNPQFLGPKTHVSWWYEPIVEPHRPKPDWLSEGRMVIDV